MAYDGLSNFPYSTVATAPSPASSGTSLVVAAGEGALFPTAPFNAVVWPVNTQPLSSNAEIVRVTNVSTDTFTITRSAEGTSARSIVVGDQIMLAVTKKVLTDLQNYAPQDGWIGAYNQDGTAETWTYASADAPVYTFTVSGDVTAKYTAGMRLKLTQSATVKYFIVLGSTYGAPNTTVTVLSSMTNNTADNSGLANSAITANYYSMMKAPASFPTDPLRWQIEITDTTDRSQASATSGVWYNINSTNIVIPIGAWDVSYQVSAQVSAASGTSTDYYLLVTLSEGNNSETDKYLTAGNATGDAANFLRGTFTREQQMLLTSKKTFYLNTASAGTGTPTIYNLNSSAGALSIKARCRYL